MCVLGLSRSLYFRKLQHRNLKKKWVETIKNCVSKKSHIVFSSSSQLRTPFFGRHCKVTKMFSQSPQLIYEKIVFSQLLQYHYHFVNRHAAFLNWERSLFLEQAGPRFLLVSAQSTLSKTPFLSSS